jgi:hypothetical protein
MELPIEENVQGSLTTLGDQARKDAQDEIKLKVAEKKQTILAMGRQIEKLKRKSEQNPQQLQGKVQELNLESILRLEFPRDAFEPVPMREQGGDILHRVFGQTGRLAAQSFVGWEAWILIPGAKKANKNKPKPRLRGYALIDLPKLRHRLKNPVLYSRPSLIRCGQ